jgi:hypothetical protein
MLLASRSSAKSSTCVSPRRRRGIVVDGRWASLVSPPTPKAKLLLGIGQFLLEEQMWRRLC